MAKNATDAFYGGLRTIAAEGNTLVVRGKEVMEITSHLTRIEYPLERVLVLPGRNNNIFATIAETIWVLGGRNDLEFITHYVPRAPEFSDDATVWRAGYGPRLRNWQGVDQVKEVARLLNEERQSRRAVISLFDPATDYVDTKDVPCNNWLHFLIRDDQLMLFAAIRSNDVIWGFSGINTFEWSVLQEILALWTKSHIGGFSYFASSFHLYSHHYDRAQSILSRFRRKTLYDYGFSPIPFQTSLKDFDSLLERWFALEGQMRSRDIDLLARAHEIEDGFFRASLLMVYLYHRHTAGAEPEELNRIVQALPASDFRIAAIEYLTRARKDRGLLPLTEAEESYFRYFWAGSSAEGEYTHPSASSGTT